ncbi:hypothetical protein J0X14_00480 [Muricauda sp. CAU 1633]|nr:hypothetical protein [Muricauda sp. CAU 1633]MBO0320753.1 hypothetical protein [Muricauda sp. CAU 1633]
METLQHILVYVTLAVAVGYLVWKFLLPKSLVPGKKKASKSCGQDNCGCS